MKATGYVVIYLSWMLMETSLAMSSSYCCSENELIWFDDGGDNLCLDKQTFATTNITLNCFGNMTYVLTKDYFPYKLNPDGSLAVTLTEAMSEVTTVKAGDFCLARQSAPESANESYEGAMLVCVDAAEPEVVSQEVLGYCMGVSSVFLALTALVYLAFPELWDLQGKSIISLCTTQAIANALFSAMKLMVYSHMTWCALRGFLAYYFNVSSFFWMNAIAIQILILMKYSSTGTGAWRKFTWYCLYAWGTPAVLTIMLVIINYHPGSHKKPGIGHNHCWFLDIKRTWIYMYSVLAILMAANLCIFVYTSVCLWKHTFSSGHLQSLRCKSWMMFRLFIIMGLPWIFEMVSSLTPTHTVWVILDIINCLQGLIVFLILVVFRRRVIKVLYRRNMLFCLNRVVEKLVGADDEEDIVTPTAAVPMEETRENA